MQGVGLEPYNRGNRSDRLLRPVGPIGLHRSD